MRLSSHRENQLLLQLSGFRYLSEPQAEEFLFAGSMLTPLSRQVITRRVLNRLKRKGLILETPRVVGPAGGTARLVYFLTARGYNFARSLNPGLPSRQPNLRGTSLMGHGLMCAEVVIAFRRAARAHPGDEVLDWECDWQAAERLGAKLVVPDAHLVYATPGWTLDAFIEVDLATEGSRVFGGKIRRYLDLYRGGTWTRHLKVWPRVLTIVPTQARASILRRVTETVLESQLFRERLIRTTAFGFTTLDELLGSRGPLGEIWSVVGKPGLRPLFPAAAEATASEGSTDAPA